MLVFKFRQSSLFVLSPFSLKYWDKTCHKKLFASLCIWIFSIASKMPPFVALIAPPSANSRILIYSNMMSHPSEKGHQLPLCSSRLKSHAKQWGLSDKRHFSISLSSLPVLPFFLFLLCPRPYLNPILKIKRFLPFCMAHERLPRRTKLLQGLSLQIWVTFSFYLYFHSCITTVPFV